MKSLATTLAAVALLSLACTPPAETPPAKPAVDIAAETAALRAADKAFNESIADVEKRVSFFSDDAISLTPSGAVSGKEAIRARATELKALPGFAMESEAKVVELAASGDMGYTSGAGKVSVQADQGKVLTMPGNYVTIWKKQGGTWKVAANAVSVTAGAETSK